MKKWFIFAVVCVLALSAGLLPVSAANPIQSVTTGNTDSADVFGSFVAGAAAGTVYRIDIAWGDLEFTYTDAALGTWNPATHAYTGGTTAAWTIDNTDGDKITVANHSNAGVNVGFAFANAGGDFAGISGAFTGAGITSDTAALATAVDTLVTAAPAVTATLGLSGALDEAASSDVIGAVTVTITSAG